MAFAEKLLEPAERSVLNFARIEELALTNFAIRLEQSQQDWLVTAMNPSGSSGVAGRSTGRQRHLESDARSRARWSIL